MHSELLARLRAEEDNFVERKSAGIKPYDLRKTITAFANSVREGQYGVIFIGVGDKGAVEGCENPDVLQKRVREAADECYPPVPIQCVVLREEGKNVVAVVVGASNERPHFTGPAYIRQGSESVKASKRLYDEMVDARQSTVAAIVHLKDTLVTVYGLGHRLGHIERVQSDYRESAECRVVSCDARTVTLHRLSDSWLFYEAVDRIEMSIDGKMKRPALIVKAL